MKIALIAGETSGDQLGGWLMAALKSQWSVVSGRWSENHDTSRATRHPSPLAFIGLGGERMQAQGLQSLFPMEEISLIGFTEVLPHYFDIRARIQRMAAYLEAEKPDVLITIDSAGFNFRVVNALRKRGNIRPKFIHYVAPTVWAYKPKRAKLIASLYDALLCLLPFEPPYFEEHGLKTHFIGHQIAWEWREKGDGAAFRLNHGMAVDAPLLALFPGSRHGELNRMLPIYRTTLAGLHQTIPNLALVVQVPPHLMGRMENELKSWEVPTLLLPSNVEKKDLFAAATAALAKSGTIGLECALAGLPSVTTYRANPITAMILKRILRTRYVNLANILLDPSPLKGREDGRRAELISPDDVAHGKSCPPPNLPPIGGGIIPELLQEQCNPQSLQQALVPLLTDPAARAQQRAGLKKVAAMLGANDAESPSDKAAKIVLGMCA